MFKRFLKNIFLLEMIKNKNKKTVLQTHLYGFKQKNQPLFDEFAVDANLPEMNILRKLTSLAGSTFFRNVDSVFVLEAGPQADFCLAGELISALRPNRFQVFAKHLEILKGNLQADTVYRVEMSTLMTILSFLLFLPLFRDSFSVIWAPL